MQKVRVYKGIPASGKSTDAIEFCKKNKDWIRVNRDDLRNMRGQYWNPKQESLITDMEVSCAVNALKAGKNVILDSTNLNKKHVDNLLKRIGEESGVEFSVETKTFKVDLKEAIKRDLARPNSVGEAVIKGFYEKYYGEPNEVYMEDTSLPPCAIFDVDGTLAKMVSRKPYDWKKVGEDDVQEHIRYMLKIYSQFMKIIIFTGRDGVCLPETEQWLKDNHIPYDEIYIRPEGNMEKDSIIKRRMFEENIRGKYFCKLVVDDRMQVLRMWDKMGLPVVSNNPTAKEF